MSELKAECIQKWYIAVTSPLVYLSTVLTNSTVCISEVCICIIDEVSASGSSAFSSLYHNHTHKSLDVLNSRNSWYSEDMFGICRGVSILLVVNHSNCVTAHLITVHIYHTKSHHHISVRSYVQPTIRGWLRCFRFTFVELSCHPFFIYNLWCVLYMTVLV